MNDMKLIMENWRGFEKAAKNVQQTHVFLFENNELIKTDFNVLLERYDNKQITEEQLIELWEASQHSRTKCRCQRRECLNDASL